MKRSEFEECVNRGDDTGPRQFGSVVRVVAAIRRSRLGRRFCR